jgi:enoyl-CoA hydratase
MSDTLLIDSPLDGVRRLTLNRPETLNAFTFEMYSALLDALAEVRGDPSVRVVVLTGSGRGFCSGHDLKNAGASPWAAKGVGKAYADRASLLGLGAIPIAMRSLPQPIITAVNGTAAGIGYTLTLAADMAIAARSAKFINTIHNAATGAELGMSYLLRAVDDDVLMDSVLEIARGIIANVPLGIALTKQSLWLNQTAGSLEAAIELENRAVQIAQSTIDAKEKRSAFFEKRAPTFTME